MVPPMLQACNIPYKHHKSYASKAGPGLLEPMLLRAMYDTMTLSIRIQNDTDLKTPFFIILPIIE
jgi:hypothetical protein